MRNLWLRSVSWALYWLVLGVQQRPRQYNAWKFSMALEMVCFCVQISPELNTLVVDVQTQGICILLCFRSAGISSLVLFLTICSAHVSYDISGHWISFQFTYSFQPHWAPGVYSASNRNEYQKLKKKYFKGVARGCVVVKVLCYKPEDRGFETRWGEFLNLPNPSSRTGPLGFTQHLTEMGTNSREKYFWGVERCRCVRLTTSPPFFEPIV
jgi:hypothetical protein